MKRREFITLLGGTAAAWPLVARAQQPALPVVGFIHSGGQEPFVHLAAAFRLGLKDSGLVEGESVAIEYRHANNNPDRLQALTADLVQRQVAVIVTNTIGALAAKAATRTVPIVFATGSDPIKDGLVTSFNRPGGNVTGVVFFSGVVGTKRLELLHQLVPKAKTIAMLVNPATLETQAERGDVQVAAQALGLQTVISDVNSDHDIEAAFTTFVEHRADALIVGSAAFMNSHRQQVVALAARHALPAGYSVREPIEIGGLMSYGASITDAYRQAGNYTGRILKGEKTSDLPVMQSTKFELVLNLKTAKALGLILPPGLLAIADEVIE